MRVKKSVATIQQLENLSKGKRFVKGDARCTAYREKAVEKAKKTKARRKKWRDQKRFAAARRILHTVTLPNSKKVALTGYDTERDLFKAEADILTAVALMRLSDVPEKESRSKEE